MVLLDLFSIKPFFVINELFKRIFISKRHIKNYGKKNNTKNNPIE